MTAFTDAGENLLMTWAFSAGAATRPTTWFLALHTADPTEAGTTGEVGSSVGYARQPVAFTVSGNAATNSALLTFGPDTTTAWGTVTHVSVWTAVTGGVCLMKGALAAPVAIALGDSMTFAVGQLSLTLD